MPKKKGSKKKSIKMNTHTGYANGHLQNDKPVKYNAPNNRARKTISVEGLFDIKLKSDLGKIVWTLGDTFEAASVMNIGSNARLALMAATEILKWQNVYRAYRLARATIEMIPTYKIPLAGGVWPPFYVKWGQTSDGLTADSAMNVEPIIMITPGRSKLIRIDYPKLNSQFDYDSEYSNKWELINGTAQFTQNLGYFKVYNEEPAIDELFSVDGSVGYKVHVRAYFELTGDSMTVSNSAPRPVVMSRGGSAGSWASGNLRPNALNRGRLNAAKKLGLAVIHEGAKEISKRSSSEPVRKIASAITKMTSNEDNDEL